MIEAAVIVAMGWATWWYLTTGWQEDWWRERPTLAQL